MTWSFPEKFNGQAFDGQKRVGVWQQVATVQTTDATVTSLLIMTPGAGRECAYQAIVVAESDTTAGEGASYMLNGGFHDVGGTAQLNGTGTAAAFEHANVTAMDCTVDVSGATARIRVTGEGSHVINWKAWVTVYSHAA